MPSVPPYPIVTQNPITACRDTFAWSRADSQTPIAQLCDRRVTWIIGVVLHIARNIWHEGYTLPVHPVLTRKLVAVSRLDVFIDRMVSQRACLDFAIAETALMPGPVFELGLGNGRTYHHMRERVDGRDIYVFERAVASHPESPPPENRTILGDVTQTLPAALERFGATASLIHADLGGHDLTKNDLFARKLSPLVEPLLAKGGLMVSSDRMYFDDLPEIALPTGAVEGRCFIYRCGSA